ncbi:MAG: hypothetical protein M9920_02840 [Verrucomicrobiae bacterium]|nr:hypothetical protein [Verrucomicrobiae bacterium]
MSLKAVHLVFVTVLSLLCAGLSVTKLRQYRAEGATPDLIWGVTALVALVAVVIYGRYFLKKLKQHSYL